jgi:hypothetical protein
VWVQNAAELAVEALDSHIKQMRDSVASLPAQGPLDVDSMVQGFSPVHNQYVIRQVCPGRTATHKFCYCRLISLMARDYAYSDLIHQLGNLLRRSKIDLPTFLKVTFFLSFVRFFGCAVNLAYKN